MTLYIIIICLLVSFIVYREYYESNTKATQEHSTDNYTSAQPPPPFSTEVSQLQPHQCYNHPIPGIDCTGTNCTNYCNDNLYYNSLYVPRYDPIYDPMYYRNKRYYGHGGHGRAHGHGGHGHGHGGHGHH